MSLPQSPRARCNRHQLATGPDGRCALCKREAQLEGEVIPPLAPPPASPASGQAPGAGPVSALVPSARPVSALVSSTSDSGPSWVMTALGVFGLVLGAVFALHLLGGDQALAFLDRDAPQDKPQWREWEPPRGLINSVAPPRRGLPPPPPPPMIRPLPPDPQMYAPSVAERSAAEIAAEEEQDRRRAEGIEADRKTRELAYARRNVSVVMYSTSWCPACKAARSYMNRKGIRYIDNDVDASPSAHEALVQLNPAGSIPTIDVEGEVMVGFDAEHFENMIERAVQKRTGT